MEKEKVIKKFKFSTNGTIEAETVERANAILKNALEGSGVRLNSFEIKEAVRNET